MNSNELRTAFLKFFEEKGHKVIPGSSLVPRGDPTLLLTSAGMVQVKPYFTGEATPPSKRLASCQKCFRTTDIESVGDATHCTFFEMLGNFSVGDYFKKEAIAWAWEFVTERLKLPPERLWITIYLDDDESFKHWRELGIPEEKILRFGEEDNFWGPAGSSGPCGPCSEIHYDFGEEVGCGRPDCKPNCECGRFSEVWNLVFTQYNQDEAGNRTPLPKPNIDTGMGLERTVAAVENIPTIYKTDLFVPLLETVSKLTGKDYGENDNDDYAMRVVAEHGRAVAFLIADGVIPGNDGRGYVLRRLLRRAALFGRRLGLDKPFLNQIAGVTIESMSGIYPELKQRRDFIFQVIEQEEKRFEETLSTGLEIIDSVLSKTFVKKTKKVSGKDTFRLYDTYGFPVELTKEIVEKSGFTVDMDGFESEMEKQRERARASHKFDITPKGLEYLYSDRDTEPSQFVGYQCLKCEANIVSPEKAMLNDKPSIVLDTTPFYAEMGGQVGDTGEIVGNTGRFKVTNTIRVRSDVIVHQGEIVEGYLSKGDKVEAIVDMDRRLDIARNHTATHLLHSALRQVLGEHIQQRGSLVAPERLRFDFSHLAAVTPEEIKEVQNIVNDKIRRNLKVYDEETDYKKAVNEGAIALFDEKYGDVVRVMRIGEPVVSAELCGGTHVSMTGEIGYFHIVSESSIGAGLRRIEALTGRNAEATIEVYLQYQRELGKSLGASIEDLKDKITSIFAELDRERRRRQELEKELARHEAGSLLKQVESIKGVNVLSAKVSTGNQQVLREMADLIRDKLESVILVLGGVSGGRPVFIAAVTPDLVKKGYNAGDIIKRVSQVTGGGGGGKANFAQAGGRDKGKLDEALRLVKDLV